jgi:hypothetical protein
MEELAVLCCTSLCDGRFAELPTILASKPIRPPIEAMCNACSVTASLGLEELRFGNEEEVLTFGYLASFSNAGP